MDESWWDNFSNKVGQVWNGQQTQGTPMYAGMNESQAYNASLNSNPAAGGMTPQTTGGLKGWLSNGNNLGTVVQGLGSLTQAYLGFKQLSMAKDNAKFQKESWGKNFANSQKTYNTSLEDRIRGRTSAYAGKENDVQAYLARHRLGG